MRRQYRTFLRVICLLALVFSLSPSRVLSENARADSAQTDLITVPFRLNGSHIYVDATLNGVSAVFVLDTGAGGNIVTPGAVARCHLMPGSHLTPLNGAGGSAGSVPAARLGSFRLGGMETKDASAFVISLPDALPCDGLIGTPILSKYIVTIDYEHREIRLARHRSEQSRESEEQFPMRMIGNTPFIEAEADGVQGWFRVDTGAGDAVSLFAPFVEKHDLRTKYPSVVSTVTGRGVGGLVYGDIARMKQFSLGKATFSQVVVELSRQKTGAFADPNNAGNLGGDLLRHFTLTIDYPGHKVMLEPNSLFHSDFEGPRSGMAVDIDTGRRVVLDVTANSPASEAGIRSGDIVVSIDGTPVGSLKPWELSAKLRQKPGTRVTVGIQSSDGSMRLVTITLRDLV